MIRYEQWCVQDTKYSDSISRGIQHVVPDVACDAKLCDAAGMKKIAGTKGGSGVWQRIVSEMPPHDVYIEPFWGRGTIAEKKKPARITIGVDPDPDAISSGAGSRAAPLMWQCDGIQWLKSYFSLCSAGEKYVARAPGKRSTFGNAKWKRHFVYIDPPYLGVHGYYKHELSIAQHIDLCRVFLALPCPAALSGYWSANYAAELGDARSLTIPTTNRAGKKVTEWLWMNYPPPGRLHDARFVGVGRRERERIKRRAKLWAKGLKDMPPGEQQLVFEACADVYRDSRLPQD